MKPEDLMLLALKEASKAGRDVRPNPKVGACLLSKDGKIISAHHPKAGGAHAEQALISKAKLENINVEGGTLAVTLEPCGHYGKTPPCAELLIKEKISKVLVGSEDPHPLVRGAGLQKIRKAGIEIVTGILKAECDALNKEWLRAYGQGYPYVQIKMATSVDGLWSAETGDSQWITSKEARALGKKYRAEADLILTSSETVLKDKPHFLEQKVIVISQKRIIPISETSLASHPKGAEWRQIPEGNIGKFLEGLLEEGHTQVLLESGPELTSKFIESGLFNELLVFVGARLLGGNGKRLKALNQGRLPGIELKLMDCKKISESGDLLLSYEKV